MHLVIVFIAGVIIYLFSGVAVFLFLRKLLRIGDKELTELFIFTLGLGPILLSWILRFLISLFPGRPDFWYLVVLSFIIGGLILPTGINSAKNSLGKVFEAIRSSISLWPTLPRIVAVVVACLLIWIFIGTVLAPIIGHDPLIYGTISKLIYRDKTISFYPYIQADPATGYYGPSTHPLCFHILIVLSYLVEGPIIHPLLMKVIAPVFLIYISLMLVYLSARFKPMAGLTGVVVLITTRLMYLEVLESHIDSLRIYAFFSLFVAIAYMIENATKLRIVLSGLCLGAALYTHTIGIIGAFLSILIYALLGNDGVLVKAKYLIVIIAVGGCLGGARYIANFKHYGNPIMEQMPVMELEQLDYRAHVRAHRSIQSAGDRVLHGYFRGFTNFKQFGYSYWLFLVGVFAVWLQKEWDIQSRVFLLTIAGWYGLTLLSMFLGMDTFIKNGRYVLTLQPFIAYIAGSGIHFLLGKAKLA